MIDDRRIGFRRLLLVGMVVAGQLVTACGGSEPAEPASYRWPGGDACQMVSAAEFEPLAGAAPVAPVPAPAKDGMQGGQCEAKLDGTSGLITLTSLVIVHQRGAQGAKEVFAALTKPETGATEGSIEDLGDQARYSREYLSQQGWSPTDGMTYVLTVQNANVCVQVIFVGYAKQESAWSQEESDIHARVRRTVDATMKKLPARDTA